MGALFSFAKERVGSLVSKKVGAAVLGEAAAIGTPYQGVPLIVYIIMQALLETVKYHSDSQK